MEEINFRFNTTASKLVIIGEDKYTVIPDFIVTSLPNVICLALNFENPLLNKKKFRTLGYLTLSNNPSVREGAEKALGFVKQYLEQTQHFMAERLTWSQFLLLKILYAIIRRQREFIYNNGEEKYLCPMRLIDIAADTELDNAEITRKVMDKYIAINFSVFSVKSLFSQGTSATVRGKVSQKALQKILQELIIHNDKKGKLLSDERMVALLEKQGYVISRRTIAKYRKLIGVPGVHVRKKLQ